MDSNFQITKVVPRSHLCSKIKNEAINKTMTELLTKIIKFYRIVSMNTLIEVAVEWDILYGL